MPDQNELFDAAVQILLFVDRRVTITIAPGGVSMRLPTTRKLAEYLQVPHYYVLPTFDGMEQDGLIRRMERIGISTTPKGTSRILQMIEEGYTDAAEEILGEGMLTELLKRMEISPDQNPHGRLSPVELHSPDIEGEDSTVSE